MELDVGGTDVSLAVSWRSVAKRCRNGDVEVKAESLIADSTLPPCAEDVFAYLAGKCKGARRSAIFSRLGTSTDGC